MNPIFTFTFRFLRLQKWSIATRHIHFLVTHVCTFNQLMALNYYCYFWHKMCHDWNITTHRRSEWAKLFERIDSKRSASSKILLWCASRGANVATSSPASSQTRLSHTITCSPIGWTAPTSVTWLLYLYVIVNYFVAFTCWTRIS